MAATAFERPSFEDLDPRVGRWLAVLLLYEAVGSYLYFRYTPADPTRLRYLVYPFVWLNVGLIAMLTVRPSAGSRRHRLLALAVAVPYTLVVLYVPGVLQPTLPGIRPLPPMAPHVDVIWTAPGWGPLVTFQSSWLVANLVPFKVVGYLALGYLVYANALRVSRASLGGLLGVVTCVSCTAPLFASAVALLGGGAGLVSIATRYSVDLGTLAFLVSAVVLYRGATGGWLPTEGSA
ncbi:MAG: hypothetical protein ABEJ31_10020 [Haloarculaceae archaeon]